MAMQLHGHRDYRASDFGNWTCRWCMQTGDEHTDATDYECRFHGTYIVGEMTSPMQANPLYTGDLGSCIIWMNEHLDDLENKVTLIEMLPAMKDVVDGV